MKTLNEKFGFCVMAATGWDVTGKRVVFAVGEEREVRNEVNSHGMKYSRIRVEKADDLATARLRNEARRLA